MSMPPLLVPQFFIGHESLKDAWANKLREAEKDTGHDIVIQDTQSQQG